MEYRFKPEEIAALRKELRGLRLMPALIKCCEEKDIASRVTVFLAVHPERFTSSPVHRLIILEAILLVAENGGDLQWYVDSLNNERAAEQATA